MDLIDISDLYTVGALAKAQQILADTTHLLCGEFPLLPIWSKRRSA